MEAVLPLTLDTGHGGGWGFQVQQPDPPTESPGRPARTEIAPGARACCQRRFRWRCLGGEAAKRVNRQGKRKGHGGANRLVITVL